jgi:hypothetical protein
MDSTTTAVPESPAPEWRNVGAASTPEQRSEAASAATMSEGFDASVAAAKVGEFFRGALDFNAMRDVQETSETSVCFVWDRLVAMPFPQTVMDGKGSGNNGRAVAKYFKETFGSKVS